ncbi:PRC-barrel domain-containing protein [Poseidonocella sp. HB161398]|uniref:PRC-barrel domain-containing protein n=1 Tax=Poseidonocella sp. HB161398 TaxID=2320855 RepID=UPI0011087803|nr:PRC-barrel domain-containing protein [Poseidonocella sp. HB161398]
MTRFYVASTALALVLATPLSAQTADEQSGFAYSPTGDEVRASQFIGARVYAAAPEEAAMSADGSAVDGVGNGAEEADDMAAGDTAPADPRDDYADVGEIGDVLMSQDGQIEAILVDVGGFLGIGEKQVAISMDKLEFVPDTAAAQDWMVVFTSDRETLENAPAYEPPADPAAMDGADAGAAVAPTGSVSETVGDAGSDAADWAEEKTAQGEQALDAAGDKASDMAQSAQQDMQSAAEGVGEAADRAGDALAGAATSAGAAVEDAGEDMQQAGTDAGSADYVTADIGDVTTEQLTGARVYDLNDKRIGEVHEVAMTADGQPGKAIVDVGGFLGIGEKRVELGFDQMNIEKLNGGDELRIQVNATEEQLKEMPEYEG